MPDQLVDVVFKTGATRRGRLVRHGGALLVQVRNEYGMDFWYDLDGVVLTLAPEEDW